MASGLRSKVRKDYNKMNEGNWEEELDYNDTQSITSEEGKPEGDLSVDEGSEEGEIAESKLPEEDDQFWLDLPANEFNAMVSEARDIQDVEKIEFLLKVKEKRCSALKVKITQENKSSAKLAEARRRKMKELDEKMSKLDKLETKLSRSLENSRNATPAGTPPRGKYSAPRMKSTVKKADPRKRLGGKRRSGELKREATKENRGETRLLNSMLNLKRGNVDAFNSLLHQAMTAADNLNLIRTDLNKGEDPWASASGELFSSDVGEPNGQNSKIKHVDVSHISAEAPDNRCYVDVNSDAGRQKLVEILSELQVNNKCDCVKTKTESVIDANNAQSAQSVQDSSVNNNGCTINKTKLTSGRVTKPDESDIKKQVKFAHEKLDPRHVRDRIFDKLSFPLLVAGELELVTREGVDEFEKKARLEIAKTICYHKLYLEDEDLRIGYDMIMKRIEQGACNWSEDLGSELHKHFDYRANVVCREKLAAKQNSNSTVKNQSSKVDDKTDKDLASEDVVEVKPVFCMEFNKGTCEFSKSHLGKWRGKKCTKWHICRICLRDNELAHHAEIDSKCPKKSS